MYYIKRIKKNLGNAKPCSNALHENDIALKKCIGEGLG